MTFGHLDITHSVDTTGSADVDTPTTNGGRAAMSRLRFDPMALIAGLVFTGIATAYILRAAGAVSVSPQWSLAVAAIGLGVAGLAGALWAMVPRAAGSSGGRGGEAGYAAARGDSTPSGPAESVRPPLATDGRDGRPAGHEPEPPVNLDK